tara:strand:- start:4798 stop:5253 length:456 start_codon:yes stop_codon:yes gene_type:complete
MSLGDRIKQSQKVRDDLLRSDFNLKINDLIVRVSNLNLKINDLVARVSNAEKHIELLYAENKELKECNCRIGKAIGLSQKQQDQLNSYSKAEYESQRISYLSPDWHEGHEEQQGYDHYEPDHEDDGKALASAGFGTDEDYGLYSEDGSDRL